MFLNNPKIKFNSPDSSTPILYNEEHDQPYFSVAPIPGKEDHFINFYINNDSSVLPGFLVFDYFGSGELYYNFDHPDSLGISGVSPVFNTLYAIHIALPQVSPENAVDISLINAATEGVYLVSNNPVSFNPAFYFPAKQVFNTFSPESSTVNTNKFSVLCNNYSSSSLVSENYIFANTPENFSCCTKYTTKERVINCPFSFERQSSCSDYSPKRKLISSFNVSEYNSTSNKVFSLYESYLSNDSTQRLFQIVDDTNSNICLSFNCSSETPDEEVRQKVEEIFNEFLSTYENSDFSVPAIKTSVKQSVSFINTLTLSSV
jgi:hypothetical protein